MVSTLFHPYRKCSLIDSLHMINLQQWEVREGMETVAKTGNAEISAQRDVDIEQRRDLNYHN